MEFALKELPDNRGFVLCDAKTGDIFPGQICVEIQSEIKVATVTATLRLHNLPVFKG